jgi:hypothetical protein
VHERAHRHGTRLVAQEDVVLPEGDNVSARNTVPFTVIAGVAIFACLPGPLSAAGEAAAATAFFEKEIGPLLELRCFKCHSHKPGKAKGGLVLDSRRGWEKGGESGPAIEDQDAFITEGKLGRLPRPERVRWGLALRPNRHPTLALPCRGTCWSSGRSIESCADF